jgi:hypothetical protein
MHKLKKGEWKNPLWPRKWWYGIPKENPMTSASGIMEQTTVRDQKWLGIFRGGNAIPAATATTAWEMIEGIISDLAIMKYRYRDGERVNKLMDQGMSSILILLSFQSTFLHSPCIRKAFDRWY